MGSINFWRGKMPSWNNDSNSFRLQLTSNSKVLLSFYQLHCFYAIGRLYTQ